MNSETYVPWQEGAQILDVKRGSFFYLVESGQIRVEPGRKSRDGRYNLADILVIKERRETKGKRKYKKRIVWDPVVVDWAHPRDLVSILRLDYLVYDHQQIADLGTYRPWLEKNHHIALAAYDQKDREKCLAYISILPIADEKVIFGVLSGKREEYSIKADEIERYDRSGGYILLANSAVAHPDRPDLLYKLLFRFMQFWIEQYPERYIRKIYAQAISAKGDLLVQHFFMAPRPDLAFNAYELDLARPPASRVIRKLKEEMMMKAPLPPDLEYPLE